MLGLAGKSLGWFLAGVAVALGFLLVPLQVAAERNKLDRTVADIARAHRDIRALETEFETRANLAQLDRWNADTLKLVAPGASQFVANEQALASIDVDRPLPGATAGPQLAAFVPGSPSPVAAPVAGPATTPAVAAAERVPESAAPAPRVAVAAATPHPHKAQAVAMLDRALLDDSVIGDLRSGARAEIGAGR